MVAVGGGAAVAVAVAVAVAAAAAVVDIFITLYIHVYPGNLCVQDVPCDSCSAQVLRASALRMSVQISAPDALRKWTVQRPYASCSAPIDQRALLCASYSTQISLRERSARVHLRQSKRLSPRVLRVSLFCKFSIFRGNALRVALLYIEVAIGGLPAKQAGIK